VTSWPTASLDPVRQLRVMAEVLPGAALLERVIDVPFDVLWSLWDDFPALAPLVDPVVGGAKLVSRDGDRLVIESRPPVLPLRRRFDVELREGWCWMQTKGFVVGMAGRPEGERTRYAHLEAVTFPGARLLRPAVARLIRLDVGGVEREALKKLG
jgi:hypothetical protein